MPKEDYVKNASDVIVGITIISAILASLLLAVVVVMNAVSVAENTQNGNITLYGAVYNETTTLVTTTGNATSVASLPQCSLLTAIMTNATSGQIVTAATNYSLNNPTSCYIQATAASQYRDELVNVSYTYSYGSSNSTTNGAITSIKDNIVLTVVNFFTLAPTIGTILAVVVLIAGIVLLVFYVRRMRDTGTEGTFQG